MEVIWNLSFQRRRSLLFHASRTPSFKALGSLVSEPEMGKRKIDPVTGKCVLAPSDLNRVKRPTRKKRTPEEKAARLGAASKIAYTIRSSAKRSVLSQKVHHIVSFACI